MPYIRLSEAMGRCVGRMARVVGGVLTVRGAKNDGERKIVDYEQDRVLLAPQEAAQALSIVANGANSTFVASRWVHIHGMRLLPLLVLG